MSVYNESQPQYHIYKYCLLLFSDRHRSFKLKLPSLRKELRCKSKGSDNQPDPENPPIPEEAVPLNQISGSVDTMPQSNSIHASTNIQIDHVTQTLDQSETVTAEGNAQNDNSLLLPSSGVIRRASSLEGLDMQKNQDKYDILGETGWYLYLQSL